MDMVTDTTLTVHRYGNRHNPNHVIDMVTDTTLTIHRYGNRHNPNYT